MLAIETFIATESTVANTLSDGWTLVGDKGGYVTQHEHTLLIQEDGALILTKDNEI